MLEINTDEKLNMYNSLDNHSNSSSVATMEKDSKDLNIKNDSTTMNDYKEVEEPCVSLTIIGENRLTDTEVFIRRGIKYSIRAFSLRLFLLLCICLCKNAENLQCFLHFLFLSLNWHYNIKCSSFTLINSKSNISTETSFDVRIRHV